MYERRSDRSKKQINYSKFGDSNCDDDDFADSLPASKKKKVSNKENSKVKKSDRQPVVEKTVKTEKKKQRPNPKDKLFDQELQLALEVSLSKPQPPGEDGLTKETKQEQDDTKTEEPGSSPKNDVSDEIILMEENMKEELPSERRKGASGKKSDNITGVADDEEYTAEATADDEDDDDDSDEAEEFDVSDDDNDSDFGCGSKKTKTKKNKVRTVTKKTQPELKSSKSKSAARTSRTKKDVSVSKDFKSTSTNLTSPVTKTAKCNSNTAPGLPVCKQVWTPPGNSVSSKTLSASDSVKSPNSGIRIGLSRNQRVKPLHPLVKLQP